MMSVLYVTTEAGVTAGFTSPLAEPKNLPASNLSPAPRPER